MTTLAALIEENAKLRAACEAARLALASAFEQPVITERDKRPTPESKPTQ